MGFLKSLLTPDPVTKTYVITLQTTKPYGGSCVKKIEIELKPQEAADLGMNRKAGGKALAATYWPGAPDVKITNIHPK